MAIFFSASPRDSASGTIYLKVVNPTDAPLPVHVKVTGVSSIEPTSQIGEVKGTDPLDLNTITEREKIVSTMSKADGLGTDFTWASSAVTIVTIERTSAMKNGKMIMKMKLSSILAVAILIRHHFFIMLHRNSPYDQIPNIQLAAVAVDRVCDTRASGQ